MKNNIELQRHFLRAAKKTLVTIALVVTVAYAAYAQNTNTFPNSGNAGIGTTTPTAPLEINKNQNAGTSLVVDNGYTSAGNAAYSGFWFRQNAANSFFVGSNNDGNTTQNGGAGAVQFWNFINAPVLFATNNSERLRISGTGQVGIGTSAPNVRQGQKLDVAASGDYSGAVFSTWSSSSAASLLDLVRSKSNTIGTHSAVANNDLLGILSGRGTDGANFLTASQVQFWVDGSVTSNVVPGRIVFNVVNTSGTATDAMTIKSSGNVGIGTTAPSDPLQIDAPAGWALRLRYTGNNYYLRMSANQVSAYTSGGVGSDLFLNVDGGNVGIGASNANHKLDVQGGQINASGGLCIGGDCKTSWSTVGGSQWTTAGSNIHFTTGNAGLGTNGPDRKLDILDSSNAQMRLTHTDGSVYTDFQTLSTGQLLVSPTGIDVSVLKPISVATDADAFRFFPNADTSLRWSLNTDASGLFNIVQKGDSWANQGTRLSINRNGNVGIGTSPHATKKLHVAGDVEVNGTINAKYQDLAEWVPSSEQLAAGTVVVLDTTKSNQVISSGTAYDTRVAGVISAQPGITLGESGEGKVLVATTGRVRVKVDASRGAIQIGDLLVTSDVSGVAMKSEPVEFAGRKMHMPGTIIGKALEPLAKGSGEILVLLSLQ